jgi:hypothetical protein
MFCAVSLALAQISTARSTSCGWSERPLQRLHPAQRAADRGVQPLDAELASSARWTLTRSRTLKSGKPRP